MNLFWRYFMSNNQAIDDLKPHFWDFLAYLDLSRLLIKNWYPSIFLLYDTELNAKNQKKLISHF